MRKWVCLIVTYCALALARHENYDGYKVYKIHLSNRARYDILKNNDQFNMDVWRPADANGTAVLVMIPPQNQNEFEEFINLNGFRGSVHIDNVYRHLNRMDSELRKTNHNIGNRSLTFDAYYRYDEIMDYLETLERQHHDHVVLTNAEITSEGRLIKYVLLSTTRFLPTSTKPVIVVEAGINPREWISPVIALNLIRKLLEEAPLWPSFFLQAADWIIIPVLNPDGYEYTHTNLRLWTKSRSTNSYLGHVCPGVNANRNFDISWMSTGSSSSPCSHLYAGVNPFSEPESRAIRNILDIHSNRISLYISIQNNGGFVTYPWRHSMEEIPLSHLHFLANDIVTAMNSSDEYFVGSAGITLGDTASGTSTDYVQATGLGFSCNLEVADYGGDEFNIAEEDIWKVLDETWRGISRAATYFYLGSN